jgi:hypothetical protein
MLTHLCLALVVALGLLLLAVDPQPASPAAASSHKPWTTLLKLHNTTQSTQIAAQKKGSLTSAVHWSWSWACCSWRGTHSPHPLLLHHSTQLPSLNQHPTAQPLLHTKLLLLRGVINTGCVHMIRRFLPPCNKGSLTSAVHWSWPWACCSKQWTHRPHPLLLLLLLSGVHNTSWHKHWTLTRHRPT